MGLFDKWGIGKKRLSPHERRQKHRQIVLGRLEQEGIAFLPSLPLLESSQDVKLKSLDTICQRAIACLLAIQLSFEYESENHEEAREFIVNKLKEFGVEECLNDLEKRLFAGQVNAQDLVNITWTYEAYWSLVWALGLIEAEDLENAGQICDCDKAIAFVSTCNSFEEFRSRCHLRDIEEILDMLDLFYNYHWAIVEQQIRPETPIGHLNSSIVMERRRGLEWLISEEEDWHGISLDT